MQGATAEELLIKLDMAFEAGDPSASEDAVAGAPVLACSVSV